MKVYFFSILLLVMTSSFALQAKGFNSGPAGFYNSQLSQQININKADATQLAQILKGVGLKKAKLIVEYRKQFGEFKSVEELTAVKGIGEKIIAANRAKVSL